MRNIDFNLRFIVEGGVVAALYIALTGLFAPLSFGMVQIRVSEALCAVALFRASAVPGLAIGCMVSNLLWSQFVLLDTVVGTLATLIAALLTYLLRNTNRGIALAPPVLVNAVLVPLVLTASAGTPYLLGFLYVLAGQAVSCYGLGLTLARGLERTPIARGA